MEPIYSAAKAVFYPWLRWGLRWQVEGAHMLARSGPVILAANHVSYLDPLVLAFVADRRGRRARFLAKQELFDKRGLGLLLRAVHQIPVARGTTDASHALDAAVRAVDAGEFVVVFPEGTISLDLEPMRAKSGTARLARECGVPVMPVGVWGVHRILTKNRQPHWQWGIPQSVVVGDPVRIGADEPTGRATERVMRAVSRSVARARELYPAHARDRDQWWWRDPASAHTHYGRSEDAAQAASGAPGPASVGEVS